MIKLVKQIGEGSIVYLCLNEIFINIYKAIFNKLGLSSQLILLFAFAGTIISLFICERIFMKTKLKVVLGKKIRIAQVVTVQNLFCKKLIIF